MDTPYVLDYKLNTTVEDNLEYYFQQKLNVEKSYNCVNTSKNIGNTSKNIGNTSENIGNTSENIGKNELFTIFRKLEIIN